ncbi:MAG: hypothetical protein AAGL49_06760, partial [Pseudomonadota bacterium]
MKLRTFIAPTLAQAKEKVRAELGEDAIIISSASTSGGGVEIRAAIDSTRPMRQAAPNKKALSDALERRIANKVLQHLKSSTESGGAAAEPQHLADLRALLTRHQFADEACADVMAAAARVDTKDLKAALCVALDACFAYAPLPIVP